MAEHPAAHSEQGAIDALYRISRIVDNASDAHEALERIIDEIMRVLPAESAAIELINPDTRRLEVEVSRGFPKSLKENQLPLGVGVTGWVALHGTALNIGDVHDEPRYLEIDPRIRAELAVPLRSESGGILGVVNIDSTSPHAFNEQHKKVLSLLAAEAGRVLDRIWLVQQLRQTADRLEALISVARSMVNTRGLPEILTTVSTRALEIIPCRLSAIFLLERDGRTLQLRATSGLAEASAVEESISIDQSTMGTAVRHGKTVEVHELAKTEEHHFLDLIRSANLTSMLCCPIRFEGTAIGVLNIYTDYLHRFNNQEKRLFESLASLGAAAIRNAQLYDRVFQTEENLRRSERLTTLGLLSAEIAHEIRNPLTVIQLLFESLTLEFNPGDPRNKDVDIIQEKLEQLESIVSRVLSFGKSQQDLHSRQDLNRVVEDTLHLVRLKLQQAKVSISFDRTTPEPLLVDIHKGQIQQALLNLLINATESMPDGGVIHLQTCRDSCRGQPRAIIRIHDSGCGIDPAIQEQIFDSFLTGRPDGTGLGLSIVKRILKSHGGSVAVEQSSSSGTTMRIDLPIIG
jgi:signal transduction histidine kinase